LDINFTFGKEPWPVKLALQFYVDFKNIILTKRTLAVH